MRIVKLFALLLLGILAACAEGSTAPNSSGSSYPASEQPGSQSANSASASKPADSDRSALKTVGGGGGRNEPATNPAAQNVSLDHTQNLTIDTAPTDRKIIRNADLDLESDSPEESQQKITAIVESKGGFVVESQQSSSDVRTTTRDIVTMTVRVPAEKFTESLDEIRKSASRVIVETVKGQDVTEEFIDVEARLKAKRALEQQFVEIMKRANSVDDALTVQRQLGEVRGEIEKIEGRKRFLENQASLSTIKVRLRTPAAFSSSSTGFFYRLTQSLSTGIDFAISFVLGLVTVLIALLPFVLLIVLPLILLARYFVKKLRKPKSVNEIVKEETER